MQNAHGVGLGVRCWLHSKKYKKPVLVWEDINDKHYNRIEIENIDGTDKQVFPMRSFVGNFLTRVLRSLNDFYPYYNAESPAGYPAGHGKMKDGITDFITSGPYYHGVCAIGGNYNTTGIQIGFDPSATPMVGQRDYNLAGLISYTTLSKQTMMSTELGMDFFGASESQYAIERLFINNSGSDVTFNESCIFLNYATNWRSNPPTYVADNNTVMVARDVFAPITIANGTGKRVRYIFKLSASGDIGFNNNFLKAIGGGALIGNLSASNGFYNLSGAGQNGKAWNVNATSQSSPSPQGKGFATQQFAGLALSTSDSAFDLNKYTFSPINNGSSSGRLYYNEDYMGSSADDPIQGTKTVRNFFRRFDNFSGASITAKSLGWLTNTSYSDSAIRAMIAYSLINGGSGVVIPDDGSLTVEVIMSCDTVGV